MKKRRLFPGSGADHGTVILNWSGVPNAEFVQIGRSFRAAADRGVEALRTIESFGRDGSPLHDFDAYPIVFLYRHALELFMKAAILEGAPYVRAKTGQRVEAERILDTHRLDVLLEELQKTFAAFSWKWNLDADMYQSLADVKAAVDELTEVDARSYAFRYPVDKKGNASLVRGFEFNLFEFAARMAPLLSGMEGLVIMADEQMSAEAAQRAETIDE